MADEKISAMTPAAALNGAELIPAVQAGDNVKTTADNIAALARTLKFTSADFTDATHLDNAKLVGKPLAVFLNNIPKFIEEAEGEWEATATGINILIDGFDATVANYTFYINIIAT